MNTTIRVRCTDQVLTYENTPVIASGALEVDCVQFEFCSKWDGAARTAVFWRSAEEVYHVLLDETNTCKIPREVLQKEGSLCFGVFGVYADGSQRPSEVLTYRIVKGTITEDTKPSDPTPDIYTQMQSSYADALAKIAEYQANMERLVAQHMDEMENIVEGYHADAEGYLSTLSAYQIAVKNGFEGSETEWLASLIGPQGPQGPQGEVGPVSSVNGKAPDASGGVLLYGTIPAGTVVADETVTVADFDGAPAALLQTLNTDALVADTTFVVLLNGTEYAGTCTSSLTSDEGVPIMAVIDFAGDPIAMIGYTAAIGSGIFFQTAAVSVGDTVTVKVTAGVDIVKKIPAKYLDVQGSGGGLTEDEVKAIVNDYIGEALGGEY